MLNILNKKIKNNKSKKSFFFKQENDLNQTILYPPASKEWFNSVYSYNKSYIKSLITTDILLNNLFKSYFNMFEDKIKVFFKRRRSNKNHYLSNKLYLSRAELKHTNTKILIILYVYNKQKSSIEKFLKKIVKLTIYKKRLVGEKVERIAIHKNRLLYTLKKRFFYFKKWKNTFLKQTNNVLNYLQLNLKIRYFRLYNMPMYNIRMLKKNSKLEKLFFHSAKLISFNKFKSNNLLLNLKNLGLISIIEKIYNKNIEIKLIELKSIHLNSDVFSSAIALKLKDRKNKAIRVLRKAILNMVKIPDLHTLITFEDRMENMNKNNILNTVKQQVVSGVRFEASGRLTRRLTAMRSVFKYRYTGSLKNVRSSYNNKSSAMLRGFVKSNLQYTVIDSKTRNGSFGLKGWISSH